MWQTPSFWNNRPEQTSPLVRVLSPLSALTAWLAERRAAGAGPPPSPIPTISVGNLVVGGQGKTPITISIASYLQRLGHTPHIVSRGYGGSVRGPRRVDADRDSYRAVGDEALLLALAAPTWISWDRGQGVAAAAAAGAQIAILDDAHQTTTVAKDVCLVAVDRSHGFGNGRVLPAGPLRESVRSGLSRADAIVLTGIGDFAPQFERPLLSAYTALTASGVSLMGTPVLAFAGIANPERFFDTLRDSGAHLVRTEAFPDHHPYRSLTIQRLLYTARELGAVVVTTEKDAVRLPQAFQGRVMVQRIEICFEDEAALNAVLAPALDQIPSQEQPEVDPQVTHP